MSWSLKVSAGLSELEFNRWSKLLEREAGIALGEQLRSLLQVQINHRMEAVGCNSYADYFDYVRAGVGGRIEQALLIEQLVVSETSFFRHRPSYDFVSAVYRRFLSDAATSSNSTCFDVWSLGCASGEEPYSLAMVFEDILAEKGVYGAAHYSIVATDISHKAIKTARAGVYSSTRMGAVPEQRQQHYFDRWGKDNLRVKPALARKICFSQANIVDIDTMPIVKMDLVFTQNMLVYFRKPQRLRILDYIVERLKPGAYLVLGLGEVTKWHNQHVQALDVEGAQVYQRSK